MSVRELTTAEALLGGLRKQGFSLRIDEDGVLLITPSSKLRKIQREALRAAKDEIKALLEWEQPSPVSDKEIRDWQSGHDRVEERPVTIRTAPRRIVLMANDRSVERVLGEPAARDAIEELRRQREKYPGRQLAAEWLKGNDWIRWIEAGGTS